jgi:hypothetical protein
MMKNHQIFQTALQHNFANFIRKCFETINPDDDFCANYISKKNRGAPSLRGAESDAANQSSSEA